MKRLLIEVDWAGALTVHDAIQSYLVEDPGHYYMSSSRTWLYCLDRDLGLLHFIDNDFVDMTDEQISAYILEVIERLKS